jgi:hypothetical protein
MLTFDALLLRGSVAPRFIHQCTASLASSATPLGSFEAREGDILELLGSLGAAELIVCMGDTLTHLQVCGCVCVWVGGCCVRTATGEWKCRWAHKAEPSNPVDAPFTYETSVSLCVYACVCVSVCLQSMQQVRSLVRQAAQALERGGTFICTC